ncbi:MAG: hypothetical protein K6T85_14525 [Gorillibacterium sp.]|nr:hypothetical protein [Gorillibacterium sp.]
MRAKVTKYKGFRIQQVSDTVFYVFTEDEWAYGAYARSSEWEACSMKEAKDFIDIY